MGVRAIFDADFSSFQAAVANANVTLKTFDTGASTVEKSLTRMGNSLSGTSIIQQATLAAKAIDDAGGIATLTERELAKFGSTAQEAAEKMGKLGIGVPANIQAVADAARDAEKASSGLATFGERAASYATGLAAYNVVVGSAQALVSGLASELRASVDAWGAQELATARVTAALQAQGVVSPQVAASYQDLARSYQQTTVYADQQLKVTEALLIQVGDVMPSQMNKALKASTDLAAGLGIDLETATRLVAKAEEGHVETLGRYGITVDQAALQTKGFSSVLDTIEERFGGQAQAQAETYTGRIKQLGNAWNDVQESVGRFVVNNPIAISALNGMTDAAKKTEQAARDSQTSWSEFIASDIEQFTRLIPVVGDATKAIAGYIHAKELQAQGNLDAHAGIDQALAKPTPFATQAQANVSGLAPDWRSLWTEMDKAKAVAQDLAVADAHLNDVQSQAALSAFADGKSVEQVATAMRKYWPEIDQATLALDKLHEQYEANLKAADAFNQQALSSYTREVTALQTIATERGKAYGFTAQIANLDGLDNAEQQLARAVYNELSSEKDRMKVIEDAAARHLALTNQKIDAEMKYMAVVNASVIAELQAQARLNAAKGQDAAGNALDSSPGAVKDRSLGVLATQAVSGVSQDAQQTEVFNKFLADTQAETDRFTTSLGGVIDANGVLTTGTLKAADASMQLSAAHAGATKAVSAFTDALNASFKGTPAPNNTPFQTYNNVGTPVGSNVGTPLASSIAPAIPTVPSTGFFFPGRAAGGDVAAGAPYIVGEKGPELFVPKLSGTIVPNGGGGAVTVNISLSGVMTTDKAALQALISQTVINAVKSVRKLGSA